MSSVRPYNSVDSKKDQIREMFDSVAWRYDLLNRLLSMGIDVSWRKKLIGYMAEYQPKQILDMATGTADLAVMAAQKMPDAKIIGIDLSPKMVEFGKEKIIDKKLQDQISLQVGDSEDITFGTNYFDAAMVAFGVRNYENLEKGLEELHRVLKPGAPLFILEFSKPTIFPVKQLFNLYFSTIVPTLGKFFSKDKSAYKYLYDSVQAFPDYEKMTKKLEDTGFKNCKWEALTFGICCLYTGVKA